MGLLKKLARIFLVAVVNLLLFAVLLELGSAALYYGRKGEIFYWRTPPRGLPEAVLQPARTGATIGFHPYFGFAHVKSYVFANNHGFASKPMVNYPYRPAADEYIVGIFGGSVAAIMAFDDGDMLAEKLAALPALAGKKVRVLNFAVSGFKQPQQAAVLTYYLAIGQHFDAIVLVDGLNEVVSGTRNVAQGVDVSMPANDILGSYMTFVDNAAPTAFVPPYYSYRRNELISMSQQCQFALCELVTTTAAHVFHVWYLESLTSVVKGQKSPHFVFYGNEGTANPYTAVADLWARSTAEMAHAAAAIGVFYLHILQANQYYATERVMGPLDRAVALNDGSYIKEPVVRGYPELLARIPALQKQGVVVVDGTRALDSVLSEKQAYDDDCCHYSDIGRAAFVNFVVESFQRWSAAPRGR